MPIRIHPMDVDSVEHAVEGAISDSRPSDREPLLEIVNQEIADREKNHAEDRASIDRLRVCKVKLEKALGLTSTESDQDEDDA